MAVLFKGSTTRRAMSSFPLKVTSENSANSNISRQSSKADILQSELEGHSVKQDMIKLLKSTKVRGCRRSIFAIT